jgi:pyruvate/2-oxoglutarate dehydrogenase complex dihydrolipoamide dehydrogenase (E3) component
LLLDLGEVDGERSNIGGDCTNSACVPSKAIRSVARMASTSSSTNLTQLNPKSWLFQAREHATKTINTVRARESPNAMVSRSKNLDIALLSDGKFVNPHEMDLNILEFFSSSNSSVHVPVTMRIRGKKFIIATGASPVVPAKLEEEAKLAGLPIHTYRSLLRPTSDNDGSIWNILNNGTNTSTTLKKVVIAGGGATACELTQSLARLTAARDTQDVEIHLVAPGLLVNDDVTLQDAAFRLLSAENVVHFHLGNRVKSILPDGSIRLSDGSTIQDADSLLLCVGRKPHLGSLCLENVGVMYHEDHGVLVHRSSLRSVSSKHVFACGDCASAVNKLPNSRTATHAAWTGYHAVSNAILPKLLTWGSKSVHTTVPRVVYTDPELACVGLSLAECIRRYGVRGFDRLLVREEGTDRADMECLERPIAGIGFVEIRATKVDGRVLGMTACGPSASEVANEMCVVIENCLTVRDIAKSLHSYPSHGYLMHRVALSMALSNIWGTLEACGPLGGLLARPGRFVSKLIRSLTVNMDLDWVDRERLASLASKGVLVPSEQLNGTNTEGNPTQYRIASYLDINNVEEA